MSDDERAPRDDAGPRVEEDREPARDEPARDDDRPRTDGEFKIFVGGISWHMNDRELKDTFRAYNARSATVMLDKMTHRSRGFGFVTFDAEPEMLQAVKEMHDSELEGRKISCNRAIPQSETAPGTPASQLASGQGGGRARQGGTYSRGGREAPYERGMGGGGGGYDRGGYPPRAPSYRDDYRGGYGGGGYRGGDYDRYPPAYGGGGGYDRGAPYGYGREPDPYASRDPYPPRDPYAGYGDRGGGGYSGYGGGGGGGGGYSRGYEADDRYGGAYSRGAPATYRRD